MGISAPSNSASAKAITGFDRQADEVLCRHSDGGSTIVPLLVGRYLEIGDRIATIGSAGVLIDRCRANQRSSTLYASISHVSEPKQSKRGEWFVRAELAGSESPLTAVLVCGDALRRYFYLMESNETLYGVLGCSPDASTGTLRTAWRIRKLELQAFGNAGPEARRVERAFNILAQPQLRRCYDQMRVDENAAPLFPYGGHGSVLVEGELAGDGAAFFGRRILAYRPVMERQKISVLLRACEFLPDQLLYRDPRRRIELSIDHSLLSDLNWDPTWNAWASWLQSRFEIEASFVRVTRQLTAQRKPQSWRLAVPSRITLRCPEGLSADIEVARRTKSLLGENVDLLAQVRRQVERQAIEYCQIERWYEDIGASPWLKPQHAIWQKDFDGDCFEELRRRSVTWFVFRQEFLFVLPTLVVSEVPQHGRAAYVFTRPNALDAFLSLYATASRCDIRLNRNNLATKLGFVGRVSHGRSKHHWLLAIEQLGGKL